MSSSRMCPHILLFHATAMEFCQKASSAIENMEDYNYFQIGQVQDMKVYTVLATFSHLMMAYVNLSDPNTPEIAHHS